MRIRTSDHPLTGCILAALAGLAAVTAVGVLTGCADSPAPAHDPNAGLFRDFLDGKYDSAGHPLNAQSTDGAKLCGTTSLDAHEPCLGLLPGSAQLTSLVANSRFKVTAHAATGSIVTVSILDPDGTKLATDTLTVDRLRSDDELDFPLTWSSSGNAVKLAIEPAAGAAIELDYVEVFPATFGLVLAPGSGVLGDSDHLQIELPSADKVDRMLLDSTDLTAQLEALIEAGTATRTTTAFRSLIDVALADLAPDRADLAELHVTVGGNTSRMELRRSAAACGYQGDPNGKKVIVTGFQPFPADETHDNVAGVAVTALDPSTLRGAQVMKLVIPVEYDRAPAEVVDAIARCSPDVVISFGQGGDSIALEQTAYNLQDTGEVGGGVPDNRGIIRIAQPIDASAPATRATLLPLDAINTALVALGEEPELSTDPGRYVCNNVMFGDLGAMAGHGRAGFIHLPYTTEFDDAARARFGKIAAAAVQATVDSN